MSEAYNGIVACTCTSLDRKHQWSLSSLSKTVWNLVNAEQSPQSVPDLFFVTMLFLINIICYLFFKVYESWIKSILIWVVFYMIIGGSLRKPPKVETKAKKPPTSQSFAEKKKTPPKSDPYFAMETEDLPV